MNIRHILLLLVLSLATAVNVAAQSVDFTAKALSVRDGMTQNTVTSMLRDSKGFLWIGTVYGLNRYDNYALSQYYATGQPGAIGENEVVEIFEDARKQVWVITTRNANIYDASTEKFRQVTENGRPVKVRSHYALDDGILLGSSGKLYKYTYADDSVRVIDTKGGSTVSYVNIHKIDNGDFLLQTVWNGLWVYHPATGVIERYDKIPIREVTTVAVDALGHIWVAPNGAGLSVYDTNGNLLRHYTTQDGLSNDIIVTLHVTPTELLVGSEGGFDIINLATGQINDGARSHYVTHYGSVRSIYTDNYDNIYVGTVRNGLIMLQTTTMRSFAVSPPGEMENTVTSFVPGRGNELWCGVDGYGVVAFDPVLTTTHTIAHTKGMKVVDLAQWTPGKVIVSDYGNNLVIIDVNTEQIVPGPKVLETISKDATNHALGFNLLNVEPGKVVALSDKLYVINAYTGEVQQINDDNIKGSEYTHPKYSPIYSDKERVIVRRSTSILEADMRDMVVRHIVDSPDGTEFKAGQFDGRRTMYLATDDKIFTYDLPTQKIDTLDCGIIQNIRMVLLHDNKLWVGANNRLYLRVNGRMISFEDGDGLVPSEFRAEAYFTDSDYIYFGGTSGLARIHKSTTDSIAYNRDERVDISLAEIYVNGLSAMTKIKRGVIEVPPSGASVTVKVVTNEPSPMRSKMYRFYFEGSGMVKPLVRTFPFVTVDNLPSGATITVKVSCTLSDGSWSEPEELLTIKVHQVWWKSWWFILMVIAALAAVMFVIFRSMKQRWRTDADRQRQHMLERDVEILANINESLRAPIEEMSAPISEAIEVLKVDGEINRDKLTRDLRKAMKQIENMHEMVDSPFEMLHPQNHTLTSMYLTARFNTWLVNQLNAFVRARRIDRKVDYVFRPDCDHGTITFNAARLEAVINCLLAELLDGGATTIEVGISDDEQGNMVVSFTYPKGSLPSPDDGLTDSSNLRIVYARWIAELDHARVVTATGKNGALTGALLIIPPSKSQRTEAKTEAIREETPDGKVHEYLTNTSDLSDMTLYVVDNDRQTASFIKGCTENTFRHVTVTDNTKQAFDDIYEFLPDIVIIDSTAKGLDGLELCKRIKSDEELESIPVIIITAGNLKAVKEAIFRTPAEAYLEKPFDKAVLLDLCHTLIADRVD